MMLPPPISLSGLINTSLTPTLTAQRPRRPLPPLRDIQLHITVMANNLLPSLNARRLWHLPLLRLLPIPLHPALPDNHLHAARPLPADIRVAAVVREAPDGMHGAGFGEAVGTLARGGGAAEFGVEGVYYPDLGEGGGEGVYGELFEHVEGEEDVVFEGEGESPGVAVEGVFGVGGGGGGCVVAPDVFQLGEIEGVDVLDGGHGECSQEEEGV